jgi:hypothetical protein
MGDGGFRIGDIIVELRGKASKKARRRAFLMSSTDLAIRATIDYGQVWTFVYSFVDTS